MTPEETAKLTDTVLNVNLHRHYGFRIDEQRTMWFETSEAMMTPTRTLHGGVTTTALDTACYLAVIPSLGSGEGAATIASSFQIIGAVSGTGRMMSVKGKVIKRGKKTVFCESECYEGNRLIAKAIVTKVVLPAPKSHL